MTAAVLEVVPMKKVLAAAAAVWAGCVPAVWACGDVSFSRDQKPFEKSGENVLVRFSMDGKDYELTDDDGMASLLLLDYAAIHDHSLKLFDGKEGWDKPVDGSPAVGPLAVPNWELLSAAMAGALSRLHAASEAYARKYEAKAASADPASKERLAFNAKRHHAAAAQAMALQRWLSAARGSKATFADLNKVGAFLDANDEGFQYSVLDRSTGRAATYTAIENNTDNPFASIFLDQLGFTLPVRSGSKCGTGPTLDAGELASSYLGTLK